MATLMADHFQRETGFLPTRGLLNKRGKLRLAGDCRVDNMVPDYSMLDEIRYM